MIVRLLKTLDFQKRMGIVTRTLFAALTDLGHFGVLFSIVFGAFALLAHVSFGNAVYGFSTYSQAVLTCFNMLLGHLDVIDEIFMLRDQVMVTFWYMSFIFLVFFILLNVLLAILVDSYVEVKNATSNAKSMPSEMIQLLRSAWLQKTQEKDTDFVSDKGILSTTAAWLEHSSLQRQQAKARNVRDHDKSKGGSHRVVRVRDFELDAGQLQEVFKQCADEFPGLPMQASALRTRCRSQTNTTTDFHYRSLSIGIAQAQIAEVCASLVKRHGENYAFGGDGEDASVLTAAQVRRRAQLENYAMNFHGVAVDATASIVKNAHKGSVSQTSFHLG